MSTCRHAPPDRRTPAPTQTEADRRGHAPTAQVLFPPLTYLKPTGRTECVEMGKRSFTIVEVVPHFGSA